MSALTWPWPASDWAWLLLWSGLGGLAVGCILGVVIHRRLTR